MTFIFAYIWILTFRSRGTAKFILANHHIPIVNLKLTDGIILSFLFPQAFFGVHISQLTPEKFHFFALDVIIGAWVLFPRLYEPMTVLVGAGCGQLHARVTLA